MTDVGHDDVGQFVLRLKKVFVCSGRETCCSLQLFASHHKGTGQKRTWFMVEICRFFRFFIRANAKKLFLGFHIVEVCR